MAKPIGTGAQRQTSGGGINPAVLKFVVALVIVAAFVSLLEGVNRGAAIALSVVVVLLLFVKGSPLPGWLNMGSRALQRDLS